MTRVIILVLPALFAARAWTQPAATPQLSAEDRAFIEAVNRPVVLTVPGMDAVTVTKDLVYKQAAGKKLMADLYRSSARGSRRKPVVVFIHGGMGPEFPLRPKEWGIYQSYGRLTAASGFAALVFNHRAGYPKTMIEEASADLSDLLAFARAHAREWGVDGDRIALAAFSGGGPLLSNAIRERPAFVRCQVGMYPIVDIQNIAFIKEQMSPEALARYSPVQQMQDHPDMAPLLILRAGKDQIPDLLTGLDRFVALALERDVNLTVMNNPGAPHGFDNQSNTPRTREILRAVLAFLHQNLD